MRPPRLLVSTLPLLLLLATAAPVRGQTAEETPETVAIPEIAGQAEELAARLRGIEASLEPGPTVTTIQTALPPLADEVLADSRTLDPELGIRGLEEAEETWSARAKQLTGWRQELTDRAGRLEEMLAELAELRAVWQRTRQTTTEAGAPPPVSERIREVLSDLRATRTRVEAVRGEILTLQDRVSSSHLLVDEALARLSEARGRARSELLVPDSPPLWSMLAVREDEEPIRTQLTELFRDRRQDLLTFLSRSQNELMLQGILFLALSALMFAMRPRMRRWARDDPAFERAERLFERPLAAALLFILFATPWIHPYAPDVASNLMVLLALVPVMLLIGAVLGARGRYAFWAVGVLFVVDRFRGNIEGIPSVDRAVLLGETVITAAALLWFIRPAHRGTLPWEERWQIIVTGGLRLGLIVLGASLILNVLGYVSLATLLTDAVISGFFLALVLHVGFIGLTGLVNALLRMRPLRLLRTVRRRRTGIARGAGRVVGAIALLLWAWAVLRRLTLVDWGLGATRAVLTAKLGIGTLAVSLGDVLAFAAVVIAGLWLARASRTLLEEEVISRATLPRGVGYAVSTSIQYTVAAIAFFVGLAAAGIDLSRFALVAGAFGVGIGFGLQNVVNNFVSGLILLFERPVQIGDTVETEGLLGDVRRIGIRSSTIRTLQGAEVIVPNAALISERVVNWTMSDRQRRVEIGVGVAYGTDPEHVLALLLEVAKTRSPILEDPPPQALFLGFGESSLDFELRVWTPRFENWLQLKSDLAVGINRALAEAGITIPFPQRDLHLKTVEREAAQALSAEVEERPTGRSSHDPIG